MTTINVPKFFRSIRHAFHGLVHAFRTENNFRIHVGLSIIVLIAAWLFRIPADRIIVIILVIMAMLILELVNTIVERFADLLEPRVHPYVHVIKDLMASTVVVAALGAVVIGLIIFWPYVSFWR